MKIVKPTPANEAIQKKRIQLAYVRQIKNEALNNLGDVLRSQHRPEEMTTSLKETSTAKVNAANRSRQKQANVNQQKRADANRSRKTQADST